MKFQRKHKVRNISLVSFWFSFMRTPSIIINSLYLAKLYLFGIRTRSSFLCWYFIFHNWIWHRGYHWIDQCFPKCGTRTTRGTGRDWRAYTLYRALAAGFTKKKEKINIFWLLLKNIPFFLMRGTQCYKNYRRGKQMSKVWETQE